MDEGSGATENEHERNRILVCVRKLVVAAQQILSEATAGLDLRRLRHDGSRALTQNIAACAV